MGWIYKITCTKNGKAYVGSTKRDIEERKHEHFRDLDSKNVVHRNTILQNAWNKYGSESFIFEVLEECPEENLVAREDHYINSLSTMVPSGFNLKTAEHQLLSETTRKKMSESKMGVKNSYYGKKHTQEIREKISNAITGRKLSPEHVEKIRQNNIGAGNPFYGKTHSEETKKKLSKTSKGRTHTEEAKRKLSELLKGRPKSEETKKKMSEAAKGRPKSAEHRRKLSEARRKKKVLSEEQIDPDTHEIPEPKTSKD